MGIDERGEKKRRERESKIKRRNRERIEHSAHQIDVEHVSFDRVQVLAMREALEPKQNLVERRHSLGAERVQLIPKQSPLGERGVERGEGGERFRMRERMRERTRDRVQTQGGEGEDERERNAGYAIAVGVHRLKRR